MRRRHLSVAHAVNRAPFDADPLADAIEAAWMDHYVSWMAGPWISVTPPALSVPCVAPLTVSVGLQLGMVSNRSGVPQIGHALSAHHAGRRHYLPRTVGAE